MELINMKATRLVIVLWVTMNPIFTKANIKCWHNEEGIRECGDRIPAKYSQGASEEFSDSGVLLKTNPKAKEINQINQDHEKANREKADRLLLNMFSNVNEIDSARDKKINQIDQEIKLIETRLQKLIENQNKIRAVLDSSNAKKNQERVKRLNNDVLSTEIQIKQSNQFIKEKKVERKLILHKYAKDSERFIELNTKH
ncbi:MAG: hypothetical protein CBC29_03385 [Methylococcaceae bacterium TMED69]|nr:MAG: hypothetical protein CBC29_03385 [Methylococcaceae bacterium TMED69]|tara:strand:+ start:450 stop:1046 length:597 start_codon:yes stop_codon:yes gene_type:complete